ncbi:MAG: hypothetical protein HKP30_11600 [Myxococcales bacterium]|nr:hypothetical protein [Myxococcales bacterium]
MARPLGHDVDEDLQLLEAKLKVLKFQYEQYFLGNRPREPQVERGEVQKIVAYWSNMAIRNTASRFKFNTLCSRFFTFRRQWDETCRKIESGTYAPHQFKAKLRSGERPVASNGPAPAEEPRTDDLFEAYLDARRSCGEDVEGLTRKKLEQVIARQESAIKSKYDCSSVKFRVVVENGKTKLKAQPRKAG